MTWRAKSARPFLDVTGTKLGNRAAGVGRARVADLAVLQDELGGSRALPPVQQDRSASDQGQTLVHLSP